MGIASTAKFLRTILGQVTEEAAILTSAGAADSNKIPALNAAGVLDLSLVNGKVVSTGAPDAGKVAALNAAGQLDTSVMPTGIGADTRSIMTSEALAAGNLVVVWDNAGQKVRKADATTIGKRAEGYVLEAYGAGVMATVYFEGNNTSVTGLTPGPLWLSTTAGGVSSTAPLGAGNLQQSVGVATSPTSMNFQMGSTIVLA